MGLLKHFRSRPRLNNHNDGPYVPRDNRKLHNPPRDNAYNRIASLPDNVLITIFAYLCPHSLDHSFDTSEMSQLGDGCMLCDLRDLANCAMTTRNWYQLTQESLYKNIRIDAVHFCEREEALAEKRRRKTKHGATPDAAAIRLQLLSRTCWDNQWLGSLVCTLRLPYMTREAQKTDLARCVAVLPNLQYVDLPDAFFGGDATCHTLRQELQARCPDIRKMKYLAGSEPLFDMLLDGHWSAISDLELARLRSPPQSIRKVLGYLPALHHLALSDMPALNDTIFHPTPQLPAFPPLQSLTLTDMPNITAQGLTAYLSAGATRDSLTTLALSNTGVSVSTLHAVLAASSSLTSLRITEFVHSALPIDPIPSLASPTLQTLRFEISPADSTPASEWSAAVGSPSKAAAAASGTTDTYYAYLSASLMSNQLPVLHSLYVRDPGFPSSLLLAPPMPAFGGGKAPPRAAGPPTTTGFNQPLAVYTKGLDEHDWVYTFISPTGLPAGRRGSLSASGGRPVSAYIASRGLGPQWGEQRESVVVGNGFGGFLAVPSEEVPGGGARPGSRGSEGGGEHRQSWWGGAIPLQAATDKRGSRGDLWR